MPELPESESPPRFYICEMSASLSIVFNPKVNKTPLSAKSKVILGRQYKPITKQVNTAERKRIKRPFRITALLTTVSTTRKQVEKLHRCLNYVAGVGPFGRPFFANLTTAITGEKEEATVLTLVARKG